jgi:membrane protein implicated in regulation of membrane protease activity
MDAWSASTWWWIGAGVLVAAELASGTFYLLMVALGMAGAALAAHAGTSSAWQIVVAALLGGGATVAWHFQRARAPRSAPFQSNRDVNLDIGEQVRVDAWSADGTARVHYRGAAWTARYGGNATPLPGEYTIAAIEGSRLVVIPTEAR